MDSETLEKARRIATKYHERQMYGVKPYVYHLTHVENVACRFGYFKDLTVRISCVLHDIVEDTTYKIEDVEEDFGAKIAKIVDAVTDREGETKKDVFLNRTRGSIDGIIVKMCDRIANIESCLAENKIEHLEKYISEHELFNLLSYREVNRLLSSYLDEITSIAQLRVDEGMR